MGGELLRLAHLSHLQALAHPLCPRMFQKQLPSSKPEEEFLNLLSTSLGGLMNFLTFQSFIQEAEGGILYFRTLGNARRRQEDPLDSGGSSMWAQTSFIIH